jgi:hypothetical protein
LPFEAPAAGNVVLTVGKAGNPGSGNDVAASVGSFFTDDATVIGASGHTPYGAKLDITPIDLFTFTYGYYVQDLDGEDLRSNPLIEGNYHAAQINVKPIPGGNYRVGYWESTKAEIQTTWYISNTQYPDSFYGYNDDNSDWDDAANYSVYNEDENGDGYIDYYYRTNRKETPKGIVLSFDQIIFENLGFFARFGKRLDNTIAGGFSAAGQDFQVGTKIGGAFWGRDNDHFFIGFGMAWAQANILTKDNKVYAKYYAYDENENIAYKQDVQEIKPESHIEVNYAYSLASGITITPFAQYVWDIYTPVTRYTASAEADSVTRYNAASVKDYGYAGGVKFTLNF